MPEEPPLPYPPASIEQLRNSARRLIAGLDEVRLYQASAFVALALEAMALGPARAVNDDRPRSDSECEFELDEQERVWMVLDGDCHIIGDKGHLRTEMWRFLRVLLAKPLL